MSIVRYDHKLAEGMAEAVEHGDEIRCMEFFEHLIVEGLITLDMKRTPQSMLDSYLRTIQGHRALQAWAKDEAIEEALAG